MARRYLPKLKAPSAPLGPGLLAAAALTWLWPTLTTGGLVFIGLALMALSAINIGGTTKIAALVLAGLAWSVLVTPVANGLPAFDRAGQLGADMADTAGAGELELPDIPTEFDPPPIGVGRDTPASPAGIETTTENNQ